MPAVGDPVRYHGNTGRVCCINSFTAQACVMFEDGDCLCVPLVALTSAPSTTAVCTQDCSNRCNGGWATQVGIRPLRSGAGFGYDAWRANGTASRV